MAGASATSSQRSIEEVKSPRPHLPPSLECPAKTLKPALLGARPCLRRSSPSSCRSVSGSVPPRTPDCASVASMTGCSSSRLATVLCGSPPLFLGSLRTASVAPVRRDNPLRLNLRFNSILAWTQSPLASAKNRSSNSSAAAASALTASTQFSPRLNLRLDSITASTRQICSGNSSTAVASALTGSFVSPHRAPRSRPRSGRLGWVRAGSGGSTAPPRHALLPWRARPPPLA